MNLSICIATYNGSKFIREQLDSILFQLDIHDEIIISDDSSLDDTIDIIKSYNDSRIFLIENGKYKNPIFNFENAIRHANHDIIVLADQDDIWLSNKLPIIRAYFSEKDYKNKIYTLVMDNYSIGNDGKIFDESLYKYLNSGKGVIKNFIRNTYLGCNMAFSRKLLVKSLPFPKTIPMHDVWLGLLSEFYGEVYFSPEKTIYFRRHGNNATKESYSIFQVIKWRMSLLYNLVFNYLFSNSLKE